MTRNTASACDNDKGSACAYCHPLRVLCSGHTCSSYMWQRMAYAENMLKHCIRLCMQLMRKDCCAAVSCACAGLILLAIGGIAATLEIRKFELRSAPAGECSFQTPANMGSSLILRVTCASPASAQICRLRKNSTTRLNYCSTSRLLRGVVSVQIAKMPHCRQCCTGDAGFHMQVNPGSLRRVEVAATPVQREPYSPVMVVQPDESITIACKLGDSPEQPKTTGTLCPCLHEHLNTQMRSDRVSTTFT
jgi:hypothetical protein